VVDSLPNEGQPSPSEITMLYSGSDHKELRGVNERYDVVVGDARGDGRAG